jgi:hypothetical protein
MEPGMNRFTTALIGASLLSVCAILGVGRATAPARVGSIVPTGDMTAARFDHTATLLADGQVLIIGGLERNGVMQPTAELFDPATGHFAATGKPQSPRGWGATAVRLADGKVLLMGGSNGQCSSCILAKAELYEPSIRAFSLTGSLTTARAGAVSLLLPSGDVLVVGGNGNSEDSPATAELYHPHSQSFSRTGDMHISDPSQLVLLKNGRVLVAGSSGAELYDPASGQFTPTGKMTVPRTKFGAALLRDGKVLIAGGQVGGAWGQRVASTEIYDPTSGKFSPGPELNFKRFKLAKGVAPLGDGRVLIGGGADQPEIYDPATRAFSLVPGSKLDGFCFSTATVLSNGHVLLAGGYRQGGGAGVSHAWLYRP